MYILGILVPSLFLLYQTLTCFGFIPLYNLSLFGEKHVLFLFLHGCICKWGVIFAFMGFGLTFYYLLYKKGRTEEFKKSIIKYSYFYMILLVFSIL